MKIAPVMAVLVCFSLAFGCGGKVQTDRDGGGGGGGGAGGSGDGGAASCESIDCSESGSACTCQTQCQGADLKAECKADGGDIICTCHYDNKYLGLCSNFGGDVCGLPGGCCYAYLP
ncbi:MAG: hypothetical protein IPK82_17770 [Polyangiaceae bacterium]|nr:hypothetical protein [Polyangiaceae bacterium]